MASRKRLQYQIATTFFLSAGICGFQNSAFQTDAFQVCPPDWFSGYNPDRVPDRRQTRLPAHQQQAFTGPVFVAETITSDKWNYPWSEPVRQKPGLKAHLQQSLIATTLDDETQIIQNFESRWHQAWSEPVRVKASLRPGLQQFFTSSVFTAEVITPDKWVYPWTEPVRQKPGLKAGLQQALIAPVLDDETQIIQGFESRWHYAWSEPVRLRQFPAAQQQAIAFQPPSFETITLDKWTYPWSEPVRQKPGLKTHLQQTLIATTLDDETQIIQDFESRWHYPWSEPVRQKPGLRTGDQTDFTGVLFTTETVTLDKWAYPWSEPKRFRPGLLASSQQFLALDTATIPVSTLEPWFAPFSEPVRQKPGLRAGLQQAAIQTVLDPDTQIIQGYESRWHYAWSEPVRFRRLAVAQQVSHTEPTTSVFENITLDKWVYPLAEPVRLKPGLRAALQQALIATTLNPETQIIQGFESRWHYPWSEPVRLKRFPTAEQQVTPVVFRPPLVSFAYYNWLTEPVRQKPGLRAYLQQAAIGPVLNPGTQIIQGFESRWHQPWSEPVRQRPGLKTALQQFLAFQRFVAAAGITGDFFATEQGDIFFATGSSFTRVASALVGIQYDKPRTSALVGIQYDKPLVSGNVGVVIIPSDPALLTESDIEILTELGVIILS